jgi:hypothetical protein
VVGQKLVLCVENPWTIQAGKVYSPKIGKQTSGTPARDVCVCVRGLRKTSVAE